MPKAHRLLGLLLLVGLHVTIWYVFLFRFLSFGFTSLSTGVGGGARFGLGTCEELRLNFSFKRDDMRWTADLAFCWNGVSTSIKFSLFSFPSWLLNLPDRAALWEYDGFQYIAILEYKRVVRCHRFY